MERLHFVDGARGGERIPVFEAWDGNPDSAVVMLHGWRSNRSEAGLFTRLESEIVRLGSASVRFDLAGHGERLDSIRMMDDLIRYEQYILMAEEVHRVVSHTVECFRTPLALIGSCSGAHLALLAMPAGLSVGGVLALGALPLILHAESRRSVTIPQSANGGARLGKVLVLAGRGDPLLDQGVALFDSVRPQATEVEVKIVAARRPYHSQSDIETIVEESVRWLKAIQRPPF